MGNWEDGVGRVVVARSAGGGSAVCKRRLTIARFIVGLRYDGRRCHHLEASEMTSAQR